MVRGDPVVAAPAQVLGFIIHFSDQTDHQAAEIARRRLQDGILEQRRRMSATLESKAALVYRDLASSLLENAQLAALEITDGLEMARMPAMLDSVWTSVVRTSDVLKQLTAYSGGEAEGDSRNGDGSAN